MSVAISQVANTDTWGVLVARLNQMAGMFSSQVVTADTTDGGNVTIGNVFIGGILGATQITTNQIRGGNVATWSNLTLVSNLVIASNSNVTVLGGFNIDTLTANTANLQSLTVANFNVGGVVLEANIGLQFLQTSTTGTTQQAVDTWMQANNQTCKYIIAVRDNNANTVESRELLVLQNGSSAYLSEYSIISSNSTAALLGTFDASVSSGIVSLLFTPSSSNVAIKGVKILV